MKNIVTLPKANTMKFALLAVWAGCQLVGAQYLPEASIEKSDGSIQLTGCRLLSTYTDYVECPENMELSTYGGWKGQRVNATGYFRVEKIGDRWWAVDPEGYLYISIAANSVYPDNVSSGEIYDILLNNGFNGVGGWSDESLLTQQGATPLAYAPKRSFLGEYDGRTSDDSMPVFDDGWVTHCNEYAAEEITPYVNDPDVFGYLSDNEISWYGVLEQHLALNDTSDNNYNTATAFLASRGKNASNWNDDDEDAYVGLLAEAYYSAVNNAIKAIDPNHLYLGSRCNSSERYNEAFMTAAGQHVDVFSMNHYSRWGARDYLLGNMAEWTGKPLMITEFYAMEVMTGSETGAGWKVADQESRGYFYQNYVSTLLENKNVVGFHWFKFQDSSNANKGMVDVDGNPWTELLSYMQELNTRVYDFIDYIDWRASSDLVLSPEADAFFYYNQNEGDSDILVVDYGNSTYKRESYIRFDVSSVTEPVESAYIDLKSVIASSVHGNYRAEFVPDNTWGETTITMANHPTGTTRLKDWKFGDDFRMDVTDQVNDALNGDKKVSVRFYAYENTGTLPRWGSREHADPAARPTLSIDYPSISYPLDVVATSSQSSSAPSVSNNDLAQTEYLSSSATGGNEVTSQHAQLFNGKIGNADGDAKDAGEVTMGDGNSITVTLDTSVNTYGYDVTGIHTYFGWSTGKGGRSNQGYKISLTLIDDTVVTLVGPKHWEPNTSPSYWTTVSFEPSSGTVVAKNVKAVTFDIVNDANAGGVVIGREFDILGEPTVIPVAHWTCNAVDGSVVADSSGNGHDGTLYNADWVDGVNGKALSFNGSSSRVDLPASAFNTIDSQVTVSMWVYGADTQARSDTLFYAADAAGNRILNIHLPWSNGKVYWDAGASGSSYDRIYKAASASEYKGGWNHWVFTKNASTGLMNIYLNGSLWHSGTGKTKSMSGVSSASFGSKLSEQYYDGTVDDVRVYNVELSADEISDLYLSY